MKKIVLVSLMLIYSSFQVQAQEQEEKSVQVKYVVSIEGGFQAGLNGWMGTEHVVVNGFRISKQHVVGFGIGVGGFLDEGIYCPIYANYRYYMTTGSSFTPHVNVALGGLATLDGGGFYSTFTTGFNKHKFTLSTGIFLYAYQSTYSYTE